MVWRLLRLLLLLLLLGNLLRLLRHTNLAAVIEGIVVEVCVHIEIGVRIRSSAVNSMDIRGEVGGTLPSLWVCMLVGGASSEVVSGCDGWARDDHAAGG